MFSRVLRIVAVEILEGPDSWNWMISSSLVWNIWIPAWIWNKNGSAVCELEIRMISVPNAAITLWSDLRKVNAIVNKVIPIHGGWFKLWFAYWGSRPGFLLEPFPYFYLDAIQESTVVF